MRPEDARLLLGRKASKERQNLGGGTGKLATPEGVFSQGLGGLADFALAGQENEEVTGARAGKLVAGIDDGLVQIAFVIPLLLPLLLLLFLLLL